MRQPRGPLDPLPPVVRRVVLTLLATEHVNLLAPCTVGEVMLLVDSTAGARRRRTAVGRAVARPR